MYLKSLVLKGFKSFADKSTLSLEPGITAIVGPNGSGKSNISDAVLWVLGERSARNLRGQAMEDIIFAGSAARKAVSIAEVDLVLDNSDNTLPVEYDEVVITRRMFRSGESEYLVNGVVSRRLDVLEILHDTGLGTGTHSIISQGSLDSILQSKPEDRRALIEEAAGVLKHKQRKEKSQRKLEAMDRHLERVRDVAGEVGRQLGPLERKAKRAAAYKEASKALHEVRLSLAVDDLRTLQREWDSVCADESKVSQEVETRRLDVAAAEQRVNDLSELMKRDSEDAGELSRRHRKAESLAERLDSAEMLVRERRRAAIGYEADMRLSLEGSASRRDEAVRENETAHAQLREAELASVEADQNVDELVARRSAADVKRRDAENLVNQTIGNLRACEEKLDAAKRNEGYLKEGLSSGLAQVKLVEARKVELGADLQRARVDYEEAVAKAAAAKGELQSLESQESQAQAAVVAAFERREATRSDREAADERVRLMESEMRAIEQAKRVGRQGVPALSWLMDNAQRFGGMPLSQGLRVRDGLESLVEHLLGEDLASLAVDDDEVASRIAAAIADEKLAGAVTMISRSSARAPHEAAARSSKVGRALLDEIEYGDAWAPIIEGLLGDVVLLDTRDEAFSAHRADARGLRYASLDGCVLWPHGRVRVFGGDEEPGESLLAQERRLDELSEQLEDARKASERAKEASEKADEAYRDAQAKSLRLSQQLANAKGLQAAAAEAEERAGRKMKSVAAEVEDIDLKVKTAQRTVEDLKPDLESCAKEIAELEETKSALSKSHDELIAQTAPLRDESERLAEELAEARLQAATLSERKTYAERIVSARTREIESIDARAREARRSLAAKAIAKGRCDELLAIFARLTGGIQQRVSALDDALAASESSTNAVHADAATARDAARKARDDYDSANARMAQIRVEKSRLEVRVEAAASAIVVDLKTPLDRAESLPMLEDRTEAEDEAFRLERRIKSMGAINPEAADEYAALKERYDFLAGQLSDMEAARRSLNRIMHVIDTRMKDDFTNTFEEVNENFNEIFGILFPGGSAHLSLEDPDDVEHSGVEVTAQPRGKRLSKMMLMSGGEKSLTALALLFAVYKTRTTPFYILDEVEAALDDTNLRRLISYIDTLRKTTQLIMITHQRRTMEMADVLFGVSMQADGVTKVISQKLERALEHAE